MKFSIVTPSFNSDKYIAETIESVLFQEGDFEIEYIIVDSLSSDDSLKIINNYINLLVQNKIKIKCKGVEMKIISEKDSGMYDAINKGFNITSGDIYSYINSDDVYLAGAFEAIAKAFRKNNKARWIKGITSYIDKNSKICEIGRLNLYNRSWIKKGIYGRELFFIQQDSVFWRSELWKAAGPIDNSLKYAGDYYLWINFSKFFPLLLINVRVSCFRMHDGQLSQQTEFYKEEMKKISPKEHPFIRFFYYKFPLLFDFINRKNLIKL